MLSYSGSAKAPDYCRWFNFEHCCKVGFPAGLDEIIAPLPFASKYVYFLESFCALSKCLLR